mmetsp:Transcript_4972/g.14534  ORF Transcript_4972/g.14534 Transcript_4972/m.14534 type:complete len:256 (+) Transcript_4972:1143-1910(+)
MKATSASSAETASRKRTARSRTWSVSSIALSTPSPRAKPGGIRASPMTSPFNWRSKYSRRLLARTPASFSFRTRPCTNSRTSGGALAMTGDSARGTIDSTPGPSELLNSSSTSATRSQREASASARSGGGRPPRPSSSSRGRPWPRRALSMHLSGLSPAAAIARPRSGWRGAPAAARSRLQRRRTEGQPPQRSENSSSRSGHGTPASSSVSTRSHCPALAQCDTRVSASDRSTAPSTTARLAGRSSTFVKSPPSG